MQTSLYLHSQASLSLVRTTFYVPRRGKPGDEARINSHLFIQNFLGNCADTDNQPSIVFNIEGKTYAPGSRCLVHGRSWIRTLLSDGTVERAEDGIFYGSGCYRVN